MSKSIDEDIIMHPILNVCVCDDITFVLVCSYYVHCKQRFLGNLL